MNRLRPAELGRTSGAIVNAVRNVPGTLSEPNPEVFVLELSDLEANGVKLRVLWWTKAPRQHQMLTSYDSVLSAIRQAVGGHAAAQGRKQPRAA